MSDETIRSNFHRAGRTSRAILSSAVLLWAAEARADALMSQDPSLDRGQPASVTGPGSSQIKDKQNHDVLGVIFANPWGVKSGTGSTTTAYDGKGVITSTIKYDNLNSAGVNGYPGIGYGSDPWGYQNGATQKTGPRFPAQLSSLAALYADTEHALSGSALPGNLDVAFDLWVTPHVGFKGGQAGSVEVMLMYYYKFGWPSSCPVLKTVEVEATVDGKPTKLSLDQHVCVKGSGPGSYVAYIPSGEQNFMKARIRLDLLPLLTDAVAATGIDMSWYISGIQFGTEFGNPDTTPSVDYQMQIRHFAIEMQPK